MKRGKKWRLNLSTLSQAPSPGEKILVWRPADKILAHAKVQKTRHGEVMYKLTKDVFWHDLTPGRRYRLRYNNGQGYGRVRRRLEHVEWVREGSDDANAKAFIAAKALERT